MNTKLFVLLAASVLALSACKNDTPTAQKEAAAAATAPDQAGPASTHAPPEPSQRDPQPV